MLVLVAVMMMMVVGGLVKICVNVGCWEKVIGREKWARAQRISQARGLRQDFQQAALFHHHPHHCNHDRNDRHSEDDRDSEENHL